MESQTILIGATLLFVSAIVILNVIDRPKLWAWAFNGIRTRRMWLKAGFKTDERGNLCVAEPLNGGTKQKVKQKV